MSVKSKMTAIADPIRTLMGKTDTMGLDAMANHLGNAVTEVDNQNGIIQELKTAIAENVSKTSNEVSEQTDLIQQIKTALEGKAGGGGGTVLPTLTNPGTASDLAQGKQLIGADGNVVNGSVETIMSSYNSVPTDGNDDLGWDEATSVVHTFRKDMLFKQGSRLMIWIEDSNFGDAKPEDVAKGKTFTSASGLKRTGTATIGGGYAIKSGTTTSQTIDTGLSDVEQFFMYKETQTGTGLIHLHYTKSATSRMYASAWSTQNYGTKTITNGTGGVTVSGGTITISATQAAQGALTSNVTYKWVAVGTE